MQTISIRAHFDGERILLDEPVHLEPNTQLLITVLPETDTEHDSWLRLSATRLEEAYSDDEPEYTLSSIREMNPQHE